MKKKKRNKKKKIDFKRREINFLLKKKNTDDLLFDVLEKNTSKIFKVHRKGEKTGEDYYGGRRGKKEVARKIGVDIKKLNRWIKFGVERPTSKQIEKIKILHKQTEAPTTKNETRIFTKHEFTKNNFFRRKKLPYKRKKQQFYFKAGLKMVFNNGYIIHNYPVAHYDFRGYPEGYETMRRLIRDTVNAHDSLDYFIINYFVVSLVNMEA